MRKLLEKIFYELASGRVEKTTLIIFYVIVSVVVLAAVSGIRI